MNERPEIRPETIKLLEENIMGKPTDFSLGNDYLDLKIIAKTNKQDYIKLNSISVVFRKNEKAKHTTQKILASHMADKGLIPKYMKLLKVMIF